MESRTEDGKGRGKVGKGGKRYKKIESLVTTFHFDISSVDPLLYSIQVNIKDDSKHHSV